ncbi:MAG: hypothetical protein IKC73_04490 [Clostridia bacterium]|nr:hypothetical protein [Clostridia bacterium]
MFFLALPFLLLSTATGLSEGVMIKLYNRKHEKGGFFFTALVSLFSMLVFVIREAIESFGGVGFEFSWPIVLFGLLGGFLYASASLMTYLAVQWGSYALSNLILSYSLVLTVAYGLIFRGEAAGLLTWCGFAIIAVSIFLLRKKNPEEAPTEKKKVTFRWLFAIAYSVFAAAGFSIVRMYQQDLYASAYNNEFMIVCLGFSALLLFVVGIVRDKRDCWGIFKKGAPFATVAGLSNGATNLLQILMLQIGVNVSYSGPIGAVLKSLGSFLLAVFLFRERFERRQLLGLALGATAVVLLSI